MTKSVTLFFRDSGPGHYVHFYDEYPTEETRQNGITICKSFVVPFVGEDVKSIVLIVSDEEFPDGKKHWVKFGDDEEDDEEDVWISPNPDEVWPLLDRVARLMRKEFPNGLPPYLWINITKG